MVKRLIWALLAVLVAAAGVVTWLGMQTVQAHETQVVSRGPILKTVLGSGVVEGYGEPVVLRFGAPGRLDTVHAREGRDFKDGAVLAEMNPTQLDLQIEQQELVLKQAELEIAAKKTPRSPQVIQQAEQKLAQATAEVGAQRARLETLRKPAPIQRPSQAQIDDAELEVDAAKYRVAQAEAELAKLKSSPSEHDLAVAESTVKLAEEELNAAEKRLQDRENNKGLPLNPLANKQEPKVVFTTQVDLARRALEKSRAEYDRIKRGVPPADVAAAEARVGMAGVELKRAEVNLKRLMTPVPSQPVSEFELKRAEVSLEQAIHEENLARLRVEELKLGAPKAEIDLLEAARDKAEKQLKLLKLQKEGLTLSAPFDCRIVKRHEEPGAIVPAFTPIITLIDFSKKRVRAEFDISFLPQIRSGMKATFSSMAFGKEVLDGVVLDIGKTGSRRLIKDDPTVSKGGEVVEVILEIEDPVGEVKKELYKLLRPGLRVDTKIILENRENVLVVPKSFVSTESDTGKGPYVLRVERNQASGKTEAPRKQYVKTGLYDEAFVEIIDGIAEGDQIVKPRPQGR